MAKWAGSVERGIRKAVINGRKVYRVQLGSRGKGNRRSKVCETLEQAVSVKAAWLAGGLPVVKAADMSTDEPPATVEDGLRHYELFLRTERKKSRLNARRSGHQVIGAIGPEFAAKDLGAVTVEDVAAFVQRRQQAGIADGTIGRDFNALRAMLKRTRPDLHLPAHLKPPEDNTRVRFLSPEQRAAVFPELEESNPETLVRLVRLALLTSMRLSECRTLRRDQVHLAARVVLLPSRSTKTRKPRAVRLNADAVTLLRTQLASQPSELVFPNPRTRQPYSVVHISRIWRKARKAVGIEDFRFHDLRHHLPTLAANEGASPQVIQAIGGWETPAMAARYAHIFNPTLDRFIALANES